MAAWAGAATSVVDTDTGAHAMMTDRSNRFAYVPHIARVQDNVLEPPKNIPGPNIIYQFRFDPATGSLTANEPATLDQADMIGPRHLTYHPSLDLVYFSNEQGCSVSSYQIDGEGRLSLFETVSTLPAGVTERNTCSQIQFSPDGSLLFVPNRGHNSIASFTVECGGSADAGRTMPLRKPCPAPSAWILRAGLCSPPVRRRGNWPRTALMQASGQMTPLGTYSVGERPMWVLATTLGD